MVYTIQTGIYHGIFHGIYYLSGTWTYCCLMVYTMVYTSFLVYTMVYTVVRVVYAMVYTSLTCPCLTVYTNLGGICHGMYLFFWYIAWYKVVSTRVKVGCTYGIYLKVVYTMLGIYHANYDIFHAIKVANEVCMD